jgi:hypothetical protein
MGRIFKELLNIEEEEEGRESKILIVNLKFK